VRLKAGDKRRMADPATSPSRIVLEVDAWKELTYRLLDAASEHPITCGETEADTFRHRVQEAVKSLHNSPTPSQILVMAGSLAQTISRYNSQTQERIDNLRNEMRPATTDSITGLPDRSAAEAAIRRAISKEAQVLVAVFYLHRLPWINARFGEEIGNQVIQVCGEHLSAEVVVSKDSLFRWRGPAFLALLAREEPLVTVSKQIQHIVSIPVSRFFETSSRTVYLPLRLTAEVMSIAGMTYEDVADQIEKFIHATG